VSPRVWTAEELARAWPLPDGWAWRRCGDGSFYAVAVTSADTWDEGDAVEVSGEGTGLGACVRRVDRDLNVWPAPIAVALAVIGAHQGRDSVEALAREMDDRDRELGKVAIAEDHEQDREGACIAAGEALGFRRSAAMLRRGMVAP
jgi:hypothetical protein